MKSMPAASASRTSARQSGQLADQRSGTLVAERPDEQLAPNRPSFSALPLYIAKRSRIDGLGRSSNAVSVLAGLNLDIPPAERSLHLAPDFDRGIVRVVVHVRPFQPLALAEVALELDVLRKPEREIALI